VAQMSSTTLSQLSFPAIVSQLEEDIHAFGELFGLLLLRCVIKPASPEPFALL
jgi:hypothetical protein